MKRRTFREFSGLAGAKSRTTRLFRQVVTELGRLGVRWKPTDDERDALTLRELASWLPFAPPDPEFERVRLWTPDGLGGFLVIHRAILEH